MKVLLTVHSDKEKEKFCRLSGYREKGENKYFLSLYTQEGMEMTEGELYEMLHDYFVKNF